MAKITRATQKIFGDNAPGTQITAFGTAMTNNPVFTKDPALLQTAASLDGWEAAIEADKAPFEEDTNGLCYLITRQLAYLFQQGISEWDSGTTYYTNSLCTVIDDGILAIKRSLTDNNTGNNPTSDTVNWTDYYSNRVIHTIGDPIFTLNPVIDLTTEVWLDGAEKSRSTYANLFAIYGPTYGAGNGSTTFNLPDFTNRTIWGANSFGYIAAGLPNLSGWVQGAGDRGESTQTCDGVLFTRRAHGISVNNDGKPDWTYNFNASNYNSIYGNSTTVQPPAIKVRVKTRWK